MQKYLVPAVDDGKLFQRYFFIFFPVVILM